MLEQTGILGGVPRRQPDVVLTGEQQHRASKIILPGRIPASSMESRLRAPSQNAEYSSVNAPWTYFFSPARDAAFARQEWMNPSDTAAPVTSAIIPEPRPATTTTAET
jgi:hypothetical protein